MRSRVLVMVHMKPCSVVFAFDVFDGRRAFLRELVSDYITHLMNVFGLFGPCMKTISVIPTPLLGIPSILLSLIFPNHQTLIAPTGCLL